MGPTACARGIGLLGMRERLAQVHGRLRYAGMGTGFVILRGNPTDRRGHTRMSIRVLLADDQTLFVENLKLVLEHVDPELRVVGIAENGKTAVRKARDLNPDVILMDVRMPTLDGVGAVSAIKGFAPTYLHHHAHHL